MTVAGCKLQVARKTCNLQLVICLPRRSETAGREKSILSIASDFNKKAVIGRSPDSYRGRLRGLIQF